MTVHLRDVVTVLLPGTGSDDDYIERAFGPAMRAVGAVLIAAPPQPGRLVSGYLEALDAAATAGTIAVGGVSLGAAVAARWALDHPDRVVAVLAALPPWTGKPDGAPAALSASHTAAQLRQAGLAAVTSAMRATSPPWLADELTRSWRRQWPELPDALDEAAGYIAPDRIELGRLTAPMGVVAAADDPIHPLSAARDWVAAAPRAALRTVTFEQFGPNPGVLGTACLAALDAVR